MPYRIPSEKSEIGFFWTGRIENCHTYILLIQEDDFNWPGNDPNRNQDEDFGFGQEGLGGPQGADLFADDPHPLFGTEQQVRPWS